MKFRDSYLFTHKCVRPTKNKCMTVWFLKLKCLIRPMMSLSLSQKTQMNTVYEKKPDYFTTAIHREHFQNVV